MLSKLEPSRAARTAPTWPSIIPDGATMSAPAAAWASAMRAYISSVASFSTSPRPSRTPQWPWSVYSSMHRSATSTMSSPRSERRSASAACTIPSGCQACEPMWSLRSGTPNSTTAPTPRECSTATSSRSDFRVCCTCCGIDTIGWGASMPSRTNSGATRSAGWSRCSATSRLRAGVRRSRRMRRRGKSIPRGYLRAAGRGSALVSAAVVRSRPGVVMLRLGGCGAFSGWACRPVSVPSSGVRPRLG